MKIDFKKILPHIIAIGIFLIVALLYCKPALEGLGIEQHDTIQFKGMAQDGENYKAKHGTYPLWTEGMFSGMPSYNIAFQSNAYIPYIAVKLLGLWLPEPFLYFFLACVTFYFLSQVLRVNTWIGVLGAIGFAYCSYDPIIIAVGHHTKMMTMAVMPALLASIILLYEKKYWIGGALTAMFTSSLVVFNHLQVVYYMLIVILFMTIAYAITWIKNKDYKHLITAGGIAIIAAAVGVLACSVNLFTTSDYAKESMRGGRADLGSDTSATAKKKPSSGLDIDYAFAWSYGIPETFTLIVPNVNGGASKPFSEDSKFYETLIGKVQSRQLDQGVAQQVAQFGTQYWGAQRLGTSGPVYLGAIVCLLFILGAVNVKSIHKYWILATCALFIMMAWGSQFMAFNKFLFENLPMYKNFRVPTLSLIIPQFLFPVLGMLGLHQLLFGKKSESENWKDLKLAGLIAGGVLLLVAGYYFSADYMSPNDKEVLKQVATSNPEIAAPIKDVIQAVGEDRKDLFRSDLIRTILFIGLGFAALFVFVKQKIKPAIPLAILLLLNAFDLLAVGRRYLNDDNYQEKDNTEAIASVQLNNPALYKALTSIQQDKDPHYRVFNQTTGSPFDDALTSAFVRSIGGYHAAKLSIYEDLRENIVYKHNMNVYNMLNTRYFVVNGQQGPEVQRNPYAYGPAWLVKHVHFVPNAKEEMQSLDSLNLLDTAVVQESFKAQIPTAPQWDSTASIKLTVYDHDIIEYDVNAPTPQFAVLSEVYYASGWNAYADGNKVPIVKTDYALRGVSIPSGTKKLVLKFEPESYKRGYTITAISQWLIVIVLLIGAFMEFRKRRSA
jgi:hypothetical protein